MLGFELVLRPNFHFLDSLVHNTEDVKELQCENILLNRLGSNEDVDKLFKKLAADLSPDYNVCYDVINGIRNTIGDTSIVRRCRLVNG